MRNSRSACAATPVHAFDIKAVENWDRHFFSAINHPLTMTLAGSPHSLIGHQLGERLMKVIVFASRKGGSGKSTLAAHIAAHAQKSSKRCLLIDADPQGSLTLWHGLRGTGEPVLKSGLRGVADILKSAKREFDWAFIDTPPFMSGVVTEAVRGATLVIIPTRPTIFDLTAVRETIDLCRASRKPYAVVINGAPVKRDEQDSPIVTQAREGLAKLRVPVWGGQITHRTNFSISIAAGEGVREYDSDSPAAAEISRLWTAITKSVQAIEGAYAGTAMHKAAA
jgi:cellulose biosynthesis protein BcsQ